MLRFRENPKAPDINALTRHYLWRGLSKLPDVSKHVANPSDLEKMGMWELLKLAKSLGANADDLIRATEQEERQLHDYSSKYPGFRGELEFDWTVAFLGQTVTRKARIVYEHTPVWEYYDLRKDALYTGWESSSYRIEMQAEPEDQDGDGTPIPGTPYWVVLTGHHAERGAAERILGSGDRCRRRQVQGRGCASGELLPRLGRPS